MDKREATVCFLLPGNIPPQITSGFQPLYTVLLGIFACKTLCLHVLISFAHASVSGSIGLTGSFF